jgi:hypothetical protein
MLRYVQQGPEDWLDAVEIQANLPKHLGALLVAQSRRLNLFEEPSHRILDALEQPLQDHQEAQLARWRNLELRKRLAYGRMRADVYTSVLLNSRPLLSCEEIYLTLPQSERLYHNDDQLTPREQLLTCRIEVERSSQMMFSDLVRVALERDEKAPLSDAMTYELCLFSMQAPLWRFSHDTELFPRLTGTAWSSEHAQTQPGADANESIYSSSREEPVLLDSLTGMSYRAPDILGRVHRRMRDMRDDRERMERALERWHDSFLAARQSPGFTKHRDSLMSSLLLFNTSYLQLNAPLARLHNISYRAGEKRDVSAETLRDVFQWATTKQASHAAERAVAICDLISQELDRPGDTRACFNFLAFGSLHHAVCVLWTMSEIGSGDDGATTREARHHSRFVMGLQDRDTRGLLLQCSTLFKNLSSLGGVSFGTAAEQLAETRFPLRPKDDENSLHATEIG